MSDNIDIFKAKKIWFKGDDLHIITEKKEHIIFKNCKLKTSKINKIKEE